MGPGKDAHQDKLVQLAEYDRDKAIGKAIGTVAVAVAHYWKGLATAGVSDDGLRADLTLAFQETYLSLSLAHAYGQDEE